MPEVVEVLITSQYLEYKILNQKLKKINILGGKYSKKEPEGYKNFLTKLPLKITGIKSKGKLLYFILQNEKNEEFYIISTFGLSGSWSINKEDYSHIEFELEKRNIWYNDFRNFGNLYFLESKKELDERLSAKAPDLLQEKYDETFIKKRIEKLMKKKNYPQKEIVKILMEQEDNKAIGSGIGNYLVAEILFDAKISPHKTLKKIYDDDKLIKALTKSIKYITKLAYMTSIEGYMEQYKEFKVIHNKYIKEGRYKEFHDDVKLKKNDEFSFKVYRQKEDPDGNAVKAERIIKTRTTYWSPVIQK